jgi:hypothetical protein
MREEQMAPHTGQERAQEDLQELEFSALTPEEAVAAEERVYLLGVHADRHRVL